jgi:hypothetical protein
MEEEHTHMHKLTCRTLVSTQTWAPPLPPHGVCCATLEHVPLEQVLHAPVHAVSQQRPPTQLPDVH